MEESLLKEFSEDFALMIEAGFIAVKQLDEMSATRLFEAAQLLEPESPAPQIGMGYIHLNKLEVKEAKAIFEKVLKGEPDHELARAFLGISLLLAEPIRKEGEAMIKELAGSCEDPTVQNLCKVSLQWSSKDLKNAKAPFFQQD